MLCWHKRVGPTRAILVLALVLFGTLSSVRPARAELTGHDLLERCVSNMDVGQAICEVYIQGLMEGHQLSTAGNKALFCPPAGTSMERTKRVIVKYLKRNAAMLEREAGGLVFEALGQAWPCK
jgi:hypothetical protein